MSDEILGTCDVCRRPITRSRYGSHPEDYTDVCTEFCAVEAGDVRARYKTGLTEGEWAVYPCCECGCAIEGEYMVDGCCAGCASQRRARIRGELLTESLPFLPDALRVRVEDALKR